MTFKLVKPTKNVIAHDLSVDAAISLRIARLTLGSEFNSNEVGNDAANCISHFQQFTSDWNNNINIFKTHQVASNEALIPVGKCGSDYAHG